MLARMGSVTVALLEALLSAGVSPERARNVVDLFDRSVDERSGLHAQILATKRDVAEIEGKLGREIAEIQGRLGREIAELKAMVASSTADASAKFAQAEARIAETKSDLVKWALAALTAQTALLLGAIRFF